MYKVIGGDQKQYGPVTADEVRHWIGDGRLNAQSLAWAEGATDWKPLGSFPEFGDVLRVQTAPFVRETALTAGPAQPYGPDICPGRLHIGQCLARSWELWKVNFGLILGGAAVYGAISLCKLIPGLGLIFFVFKGVLEGGLYLLFLRRIRGQPAGVGDVFSGFNIAFLQLLLVGIVGGLLSALGFCCCLIPGIYLAIAWTFATPLVIDKKMEFWSALELSRKVVTPVWFEMLGLLIVAYAPFIIGAVLLYIFLGAGSSTETTSAIQTILSSGNPDPTELMKLLWKVTIEGLFVNFLVRTVLIFNLPFAVGAVMYAYEDLFGTRRTPTA